MNISTIAAVLQFVLRKNCKKLHDFGEFLGIFSQFFDMVKIVEICQFAFMISV